MLTEYYWISSASLHPPTSVTRSAGFANVFAWLVLGFRCAPPQALRCCPLRGFRKCFCMAGSWGSAALHPSPYGVARSAAFANAFAWLVLAFRCAPPQTCRCPPLPRFRKCLCMAGSWGSAALHARLYAVARSAGFANVFAWLVLEFRCALPQTLRCRPLRGLCKCSCMAGPGVPLRSTPGFTLSPRSAGLANVFAWLILGFRCAPPQALRCRRAPRACIAPLGAALRYFALRHFDHYAALHRPIPEPVKHRIDLLKRLGFNNRLHLSVCGKLQSFLHVFTCAHNRSANREPLQHDVED